MLSDTDAHLLELYLTQGHRALAAQMGHLATDDFLTAPHIVAALRTHDSIMRRADLMAARRRRGLVYDALEKNLEAAADPVARFRAAWALLRSTQVPLLTPEDRPAPREPRSQSTPGDAANANGGFRAPGLSLQVSDLAPEPSGDRRAAAPRPPENARLEKATRDEPVPAAAGPEAPSPGNAQAGDTRPHVPGEPRSAGNATETAPRGFASDAPRSMHDRPSRAPDIRTSPTAAVLAAAGAPTPRARDRP